MEKKTEINELDSKMIKGMEDVMKINEKLKNSTPPDNKTETDYKKKLLQFPMSPLEPMSSKFNALKEKYKAANMGTDQRLQTVYECVKPIVTSLVRLKGDLATLDYELYLQNKDTLKNMSLHKKINDAELKALDAHQQLLVLLMVMEDNVPLSQLPPEPLAQANPKI
ncbi:PREDICTED: uncharacterized protein LOC105455333 isoform X2 [Wasmannia auropunctata]|uniref:uncharacterized protein LOC105455333 isoform X2 n=1 Tax=Wasmannia auropunctata TaxID=64793 RepID=UPI0005EF565A|nr:PREDICTED: uncharacterized protein LOC105455333 isoform X2 [Wasmannia auropunctata]